MVSGPELLGPFAELNRGKPYPGQVKPCNFLLAAHVRPFGHPEGADPSSFQLIAPFERDPGKWERLPWIDRATGEPYRITTTDPTGGVGIARVKTYRDVLEEFCFHPEAKSVGEDGKPCDRGTVGLLERRVVSPSQLVHVGKESNKLEEVEAGLEHDAEAIWTVYEDLSKARWMTELLPTLKQMRMADIATATGLSTRALRAIRNGHALPNVRNRRVIETVASGLSVKLGSATRVTEGP
ncbi:MAG: hypothetical protein QOF01_2641 [Thermomicrobiales bacterium]|nr:hypothetical protein [Thermomicrobiales bacterium]